MASKAVRRPWLGFAGHGGELGVGVPAAGQRDLEDEGLVPLEPGAGVEDVRLGLRTVDLQECLGESDKATAVPQRVRERVHGLLGVRQDRLHGLGDLPGLQLGGGRVERNEGTCPGADGLGRLVIVAAQQLVRRMGQLQAVVEDGDLAGEHRARAGQQLLVGLVHAVAEEDQLEAATAVRDGHFEALALAAGRLRRGEGVQARVGDLGDHRHMLVHGQVGEVGELATLLVSAGIVVQQITDGVQAKVLGHHLRGGGTERIFQWFFERGHEIHCTPPH